jgi:predicted nucleic acid-binding protein
MAYKIFLDANIVLDLTLKRKEFENVKNIFNNIQKGIFKAYISSSVLHIVSYILNKEYSVKATKDILITLLQDVTLIDCPNEIAVNALISKINDIEDALQYYVALNHKMDYFISNDKQLKKESLSTLPVLNSSDFVIEFMQ